MGTASVLLAAGGMPDHVHLLCSPSKELPIAEVLRIVNASSSKWIHETFSQHDSFAWQAGHGTFTVSYSHLDGVKRYLARQAEHNRRMTFQEEFRTFLRKHDLAFDERYLWD